MMDKNTQTSKIEAIKAEIAKELCNSQIDHYHTQDDVDHGICIGLQMALNVITTQMARA